MLNVLNNDVSCATRKSIKILTAIICVSGITLSTLASAADWSDTFVGYRQSSKFQEPGAATDIRKDILSFTHVSGYKYGSNFFTSDFLMSDDKDPANGGGGGAQEVYAVYRHQLSLRQCK